MFAHIDSLRLPERVYIAGAGPSLKADLEKIPAGSYVVACNRAIMASSIFSLWMAFDSNAPRFPWFRHPVPVHTIVLHGYRLHKTMLAGAGSRADLTWSSHKIVDRRMLIPGGLQGGATVVGCAIQLMYWGGADHITLAGCPMSGHLHYDGTPARKSRGVWPQATKLRKLCTELRMRRITVDSLSWNAMGLPIIAR